MDRLLEATARAERDHFWFRGFRRFVQPLLAEAARSSRTLLALDCGCGTGNNLTLLRRHGRAVGIDVTWSGLAYARGRGERQVACASATRLPFPSAQFDLVASFDVLYAFDDEMEKDGPCGHRYISSSAARRSRAPSAKAYRTQGVGS